MNERPDTPNWAHAPQNALWWGGNGQYLAAWYSQGDEGHLVCIADYGEDLSETKIPTVGSAYKASRPTTEGLIPRPDDAAQPPENDINNW